MNKSKACSCGRGWKGVCNDSHKLTPRQWEKIQQHLATDKFLNELKTQGEIKWNLKNWLNNILRRLAIKI